MTNSETDDIERRVRNLERVVMVLLGLRASELPDSGLGDYELRILAKEYHRSLGRPAPPMPEDIE